MPLHNALATAFGDEVVILNAEGTTLMLLDSWAARIWRSCEGRSLGGIRSICDGSPERVEETLRTLAQAGLILPAGDTWIRGPVEWVT